MSWIGWSFTLAGLDLVVAVLAGKWLKRRREETTGY